MSTLPQYLIVGLGNVTHPATRHSVGHLIIDSLAARFGIRMDFDRAVSSWVGSKELDVHASAPFKGKSAVATVVKARFTFIKPKPLMNISGPAVSLSLRKHISPPSTSRLIVIHDSLSHRPLHVSPKVSGSAEGHNGVRSIIQALGGDTRFGRMRIGVGRGSGDVAMYVLERLSAEEKRFWNAEGLDILWKEIEKMVIAR